ncbi:MAG: PAS domain S-box protein [Chloroflexi bacterium]|nr:PAS domain S-box protein [Chloroflexota bacterium]
MPEQTKNRSKRHSQRQPHKQSSSKKLVRSPLKETIKPQVTSLHLEREAEQTQHDVLLAAILGYHSAIFDAASDGISVYDLKGNLMAVNDALVRMHGCASKDELIGRNGIDFVAKKDQAQIRENVRRLIASGENTRSEFSFLRKDGTEFLGEVGISLIRDAANNPVGLAAIIRDITSQRQAEQALKTSQDYARNIIDSSLDMIIAVDMDRRITEFNRAAERTFGYRQNQVLGKNIDILYANPTESRSVNQSTHTEDQFVRQILNKRKNGEIFPALLSASVLRDSNGTTIGFMGISRDISKTIQAQEEQKLLFEEVRLGRERMKALSKRLLEIQESERREIARELHDEIGQAVTSVQMSLQMIEPGVADPIAQIRLEDTLNTVEHILQKVRSMSLELRPSMLDDFGLVPAADWYLERQAQRTGLNIQFTATPLDRRPASEIETVCYRVIQEAITNVIRHAQATEVLVDLKQEGAELNLTIQDNGIGMDVAKVLAQATRGTSMGLLGLRERVMLVGGNVSMHSAPAQGTRIQVQVAFEPYNPLKERRSQRRKE